MHDEGSKRDPLAHLDGPRDPFTVWTAWELRGSHFLADALEALWPWLWPDESISTRREP